MKYQSYSENEKDSDSESEDEDDEDENNKKKPALPKPKLQNLVNSPAPAKGKKGIESKLADLRRSKSDEKLSKKAKPITKTKVTLTLSSKIIIILSN